jgi:hypothetical protein
MKGGGCARAQACDFSGEVPTVDTSWIVTENFSEKILSSANEKPPTPKLYGREGPFGHVGGVRCCNRPLAQGCFSTIAAEHPTPFR